MNVQEVFKLADRLVFSETGNHLDDLQGAILRGVWQGQRYLKIAEECECSEGHVKDVASKLWKILSDVLDEDISKSNFRSAMERSQFSIVSSHYWKDIVQIGNVNVCPETFQSKEVPSPSHQEQTPHEGNTIKVRKDLSETPDIFPFYGRTEELDTLKKWIVQERCHLLAILGLSGVGKTALTAQLVEQIQDEFEYVIWRSIRAAPPLAIIERSLLQFLSIYQKTQLPGDKDARISQLIEYFQKYRCFVILDDVQMVMSSGQLAGNYEAEYEDYGLLFKRMAESHHKSCLLLLSWDKPREIAALEGEKQLVHSLQLKGLDESPARKILKEKELSEEEIWEELINLYRGNPLWLKIVATMIQDLFSGSVSEFFNCNSLFLNEDLQFILAQHFNRLSGSEKQVMSALASEAEPLLISQLIEVSKLAPSRLLDSLQSLGRRSLIEKKEQGNKTLFTLQPVLRQYVKTQSQNSK